MSVSKQNYERWKRGFVLLKLLRLFYSVFSSIYSDYRKRDGAHGPDYAPSSSTTFVPSHKHIKEVRNSLRIVKPAS
jgi:hypothetical protein